MMSLEDKMERATILLEALPYIRKFSGKTVVIKYGGSIMINDDLKHQFARDIALLKYVGLNPIIVHGGGKEITKWMDKLGKEAEFIDGLRVTDSETLEITEMVLVGKINSEIVSLINREGGKAVGLSGKDGPLFFGKRHESEKYKKLGFVGDITNVDNTLIHTLSADGFIPVISSIGQSDCFEGLNMNADHVAEAIASSLEAQKLVFLTDVKGLVIEKKLQVQISSKQAKTLLTHPDVKGGMLPKLTCAMNAIKHGVKDVHIINGTIEHAVLLELFTDSGIGTMIKDN
ncbi:MAG: acetylglutamate kinase [Rickettsiales bacterium]|nr:acetylglutamate kinase [Rickettsiales bacterium]|tara:strand:+ start:1692 stop:2555 length:864 start_codon:yes stop_codon:yes gene_type:complete